MLLIWDVVTGRYYRYYAFGATESENVSLNQEYKYTGKPMDDEFDLDIYYYGARYYQPSLGRWIAVDPLHNKYPGWSPYVFTLDNPIKYLDPNGCFVIIERGDNSEPIEVWAEMAEEGSLGNDVQDTYNEMDSRQDIAFHLRVGRVPDIEQNKTKLGTTTAEKGVGTQVISTVDVAKHAARKDTPPVAETIAHEFYGHASGALKNINLVGNEYRAIRLTNNFMAKNQRKANKIFKKRVSELKKNRKLKKVDVKFRTRPIKM